MRYHIFTEEASDSYDIAILCKPSSFNKDDLIKYYIKPLEAIGISRDRIIAYDLAYAMGKVTASLAKEYVIDLLPTLEDLGVKHILCTDAQYFKTISKQKQADKLLGYIFDVPNYQGMKITFGLSYSALIYNPNNHSKMSLGISTLKGMIQDDFNLLGSNIIDTAVYPSSIGDISNLLSELSSYPSVTVDIETTSLNFWEAEIVSIAFAVDKHNGGAFMVNDDPQILAMLKEWFINYQGNVKYHNVNFDVKVLIYKLFMNNLLDTEGIIQGIEVMTKSIDDTKIIAYLALNSTTKPEYSLKSLAYEYTGNYAEEDIKNIRKMDKDKLLQYNLTDTLATWYVYDKYYQVLVDENLLDLYHGLMLDSMRVLLQIELTGLPLDLQEVAKVKADLQQQVDAITDYFNNTSEVQEALDLLRQEAVDKKNQTLKKTKHDISMPKYQNMKFNLNSGAHLIKLLYSVIGLPVIDLTDTKLPATGNKTIKKLINHASPQHQIILKKLLDYLSIIKILTSFIPAFENAVDKGQEVAYLHGSFIIGGTVSGRLSSKNPNMQNLPSSSKLSKLIKQCFKAPQGELFVGADFASLEDRINALLTKDTNKLKVYTDGYDGHSLRAYNYWKDEIHINQVEESTRCFEVNGIRFTEFDEIIYKGIAYNGLDFYNKFTFHSVNA